MKAEIKIDASNICRSLISHRAHKKLQGSYILCITKKHRSQLSGDSKGVVRKLSLPSYLCTHKQIQLGGKVPERFGFYGMI